MPDTRQFLVSVEPSPEGYEARVQPMLSRPDWGYIGADGPEFAGQGASEVAACLAALTQAKLGESVPGRA